ncbi:hypothetical protein MT391_09450 [Vibrio sp. 1-Bac 57]
MKKLFALFTSAALLFVVSTASAVPIDGTINFTGGSSSTSNALVTEVTSVTFNTQKVNVATGDFSAAGILHDDAVMFTNLNPIAAQTSLWSVGGFTFDLVNVLSNNIYAGSAIVISGTGIVKAIGFDDTFFTWLYTSQTGKNQSFSASSIPAPAGTALLGLTLLAFGLSRRNKKS